MAITRCGDKLNVGFNPPRWTMRGMVVFGLPWPNWFSVDFQRVAFHECEKLRKLHPRQQGESDAKWMERLTPVAKKQRDVVWKRTAYMLLNQAVGRLFRSPFDSLNFLILCGGDYVKKEFEGSFQRMAHECMTRGAVSDWKVDGSLRDLFKSINDHLRPHTSPARHSVLDHMLVQCDQEDSTSGVNRRNPEAEAPQPHLTLPTIAAPNPSATGLAVSPLARALGMAALTSPRRSLTLVRGGGVGLQNIGNTCYMNSV